MGAWAEMTGVIEGVIYGHSLTLSRSKFCLAGTPKGRVQAIAAAFGSDAYRERPVLMDDVQARKQARDFRVRFFPCK